MISQRWAHDPAQYRFPRTSPAEQRHLPFDDERPSSHLLAGVAAVALVLIVVCVALLTFHDLTIEQAAADPIAVAVVDVPAGVMPAGEGGR